MVLNPKANLRRLSTDLRRYQKHTRSQSNDIRNIIWLLVLCYSYSIYSACMSDIENSL